ncbi:hypothetical protein M3Y98_00793200 [Aphelenchoides besseyi]|nr:hypothetical protein M3Y98_00793200 [Aphelenchoides besseyi]KAI6211953.1 hypothetical protein M3Y96_00488900 [Aphelenchoides besseyi]
METKPKFEHFLKNWNPCKNATSPLDNCYIELEYHEVLSLAAAIFFLFISLTSLSLMCSFCSSGTSGCIRCGRKFNQMKSKRSVKSQRPTQRTVIAARPATVRMDSTEETSDIPSVRVSARTNGPFAQSRR